MIKMTAKRFNVLKLQRFYVPTVQHFDIGHLSFGFHSSFQS
jgi:hypothetical protein